MEPVKLPLSARLQMLGAFLWAQYGPLLRSRTHVGNLVSAVVIATGLALTAEQQGALVTFLLAVAGVLGVATVSYGRAEVERRVDAQAAELQGAASFLGGRGGLGVAGLRDLVREIAAHVAREVASTVVRELLEQLERRKAAPEPHGAAARGTFD